MFKNEEYSSFLNIFTKIKFKILLIYKFYIPISTFRVSYKATTISVRMSSILKNFAHAQWYRISRICAHMYNALIVTQTHAHFAKYDKLISVWRRHHIQFDFTADIAKKYVFYAPYDRLYQTLN